MAIVPEHPLTDVNSPRKPAARESEAFDLSRANATDDEAFSRSLWRVVRGENAPYPGATRMSALEAVRSR